MTAAVVTVVGFGLSWLIGRSISTPLQRLTEAQWARSGVQAELGPVTLAGLVRALEAATGPSPYTGQESRDIKALSSEDVESLMEFYAQGRKGRDFDP